MRSNRLVASVFAVCFLVTATAVLGASEPSEKTGVQLAEKTSTEEELLMYYDEKELVTANKRPTSLRKAPAIATIITADEIRNMGARYLVDILKMIPGLGISTNEFGKNMVEVRGIRSSLSERILVMIDGHSLNKNVNGSALYNVGDIIPVENIKQVEVVRGPGSALYGNSAFVATVNIITRNAEEINGLEVKSGGGSFDTFKGNVVAGKAIGDKLTFSASVDHYQTNGPGLRIERDALSSSGTSLAPGPADSSVKQTDIFFKLGYGDFSFRGHYLTKQQGMYIGLASALNEDSQDRIDNYWGEMAYKLNISEGLSSNLKLRYDYYDQDPYCKIYPNGANFGLGVYPNGLRVIPMVKNRNIGVEQQFDWDVFEDNHLIAGASFDLSRQYGTHQVANYNPLTYAYIGSMQQVVNWNKDVTRETWALYAQDEWQALETVNLTAGVRYDHYSDFGGTTNPRVALVWSLLDNVDLKLLYGQAFRAPNFNELYNVNNPVLIGSPKLNPERIRTYEAALAYRLNRFFAVDLNYFYSEIDNMISWTTGSPGTYVNQGKNIVQGMEVGVSGSYASDFYWKLSYAYQEPRDAGTNKPIPYVPSQRAKASLNYALNKYVNLHTDLLWTGVRPRTEGESRTQMPAYFTADLAVTFKNFFKTLEIQAAVRNMFDQQYKDPDISGTANKVPGDFPREGISALITASYKF